MSTYIEDVEKVLRELRGKAPFSFIYERVFRMREGDLKKDENVIREVENTLNKNKHIFKGSEHGTWELVNYITNKEKAKASNSKNRSALSPREKASLVGITSYILDGVDYSEFPSKLKEYYRKEHLEAVFKAATVLKPIAGKTIKTKSLTGTQVKNDKGGAILIQLKEKLESNDKLKSNKELSKDIPLNKPIHNVAKSQGKYTVCEYCGVKLNVKKVKKHKEILCPAVNKNSNKKPTDSRVIKGQQKPMQPKKSSISAPNEKPVINPNIEIYDSKRDHKVERNLDGSRDYQYPYRDQGKYGSHSMYDDMGDETSS